MIKFTKEEISLCKQVAEKHRKKIEYGDWYYSKHLKEALLQSPFINVVRDREIINRDKNVFFLWTISDCLEFLQGKVGIWYELKGYKKGPPYDFLMDFTFKAYDIEIKCETPLEACLKAVLAVLEEGK